jgi:hypothetical protein
MLVLAVKNQWTRKELREQVAKVKAAGKDAPEEEWVTCYECKGTGKVRRHD